MKKGASTDSLKKTNTSKIIEKIPEQPEEENGGRKMPEIVRYNDSEKYFIDNVIKSDITDHIPDTPDIPGSEFVVNRPYMYWLGYLGTYTGWWVNQQPHGRGTWIKYDRSRRIDSNWKLGRMHGKGRHLYDNGKRAFQGEYKDGNYTGDILQYSINGSILQYKGGYKWDPHNPKKH